MSEELLKALELEKIVSLPVAAKIAGISPDGFKRHYAHLIRKITPRRIGVKVRDVIAIGSGLISPYKKAPRAEAGLKGAAAEQAAQ